MKNYILVILLCFCIQIQAQEIKEYTCEELEEFARVICSSATRLSRSDSISEAGNQIQLLFILEFGIDKNDPNYKKLVAAVYNKYADCFICRDKPTSKTRNPEQFMKRVVSLGMYETILYDFFLYDEEEYPINVNTVEILPGCYAMLYKIVENDLKEIKQLKRVIVKDYNAKTAAELKK